MFFQDRKFKDLKIWVEEKKRWPSEYNDAQIFMRDHDDNEDGDSGVLYTINAVESFCRDAKLVDLESGEGAAGNRWAALLDDRSARGGIAGERVRQYHQPLTPKGLYNALKEKVRE